MAELFVTTNIKFMPNLAILPFTVIFLYHITNCMWYMLGIITQRSSI